MENTFTNPPSGPQTGVVQSSSDKVNDNWRCTLGFAQHSCVVFHTAVLLPRHRLQHAGGRPLSWPFP